MTFAALVPAFESRAPRQTATRVRWYCLSILAMGLGLAVAMPASGGLGGDLRTTSADTGKESSPAQIALRTREGTDLVDAVGTFRSSGGRLLFHTADGKRQFVALENLNLERVARAEADSHQTLQWEVTGTITEYRGANFVLIRRAVLRQDTPSAVGAF